MTPREGFSWAFGQSVRWPVIRLRERIQYEKTFRSDLRHEEAAKHLLQTVTGTMIDTASHQFIAELQAIVSQP